MNDRREGLQTISVVPVETKQYGELLQQFRSRDFDGSCVGHTGSVHFLMKGLYVGS